MAEVAKILLLSLEFSVPHKIHTSMLPTASAFRLPHLKHQSRAAFLWATAYLSQNTRLTPGIKLNLDILIQAKSDKVISSLPVKYWKALSKQKNTSKHKIKTMG